MYVYMYMYVYIYIYICIYIYIYIGMGSSTSRRWMSLLDFLSSAQPTCEHRKIDKLTFLSYAVEGLSGGLLLWGGIPTNFLSMAQNSRASPG